MSWSSLRGIFKGTPQSLAVNRNHQQVIEIVKGHIAGTGSSNPLKIYLKYSVSSHKALPCNRKTIKIIQKTRGEICSSLTALIWLAI